MKCNEGSRVGDSSAHSAAVLTRFNSARFGLLHKDDTFFASDRVGQKFTSPEIGAWIWESLESELVYTISEYSEIDLPKQELWEVLGYKLTHRLQKSQVHISDKARSNLLQKYSSVEEAYHELNAKEPIEDDERRLEEIEEQKNTITEVRGHTEIQWYLIRLGLIHNHDIYVAETTGTRGASKKRLGEDCVEELSIVGFSEVTKIS